MQKVAFIVILVLHIFSQQVKGFLNLDFDQKHPAFDQQFYEEFLDAELCREQLDILRKHDTLLALQFVESGIRVPRGILTGNFADFGNYYQCLGIDEKTETSHIEGKYCMINVPFDQEFQLPEIPGISELRNSKSDIPEWIHAMDFNVGKLKVNRELVKKIQLSKEIETSIQVLNGEGRKQRSLEGTGLENLEFNLAVCIPKVCTTQEWMNGFLFNISDFGFDYSDRFCRVKGDKPWAPADIVAVVIFSVLGFLTLLSTCYDVRHTYILKTEPKQISTMKRCFSLYTNCRRLLSFTKSPGALECIDGIRAISMAWIILGHTFSTLTPSRVNMLDTVSWTLSIDSTWVTAAPICVDTFFMLSGLLLVYTTAGKFNGMKLLKNLHVFYLNRLLRMFPLLAAGVLIQASFLYRLADGPQWDLASKNTDDCRKYWWSTLLYVQNFFNTFNMCLGHTWYLAVDMQMHIISPLVLFWVLSGSKVVAWVAMSAALLCVLVAATVYNFINEFPAAVITATRGDNHDDYMMYYYLNTLTRAAPFFVGMIFGYILHQCRGKKIQISKITILLLWICAITFVLLGVFASHPMKSFDWDNQTMDSLINSFARSIWAIGIGCIIFACVHGYGGPVDWLLSLQVWKLPSRLSYGMYIFHFPLMYVTAGTLMHPLFFSVGSAMYRFFSEWSLAFLISFCLTIFIDSPFSTLFKLLMGGGAKKPESREKKENINDNVINRNDNHEYRERITVKL